MNSYVTDEQAHQFVKTVNSATFLFGGSLWDAKMLIERLERGGWVAPWR